MKTSIAICAGFLLYGAAGLGPATAQVVPIDPRTLDFGIPPYQVMTIVRSTGLIPVSRPIRRGPNYIVIATDRSGGQVRVLVDAHYGDVRRIHPVMAPYPNAWAAAPYGRPPGLVPLPGQGYGPEARIQPMPPDEYDLPAPLPPNAGFEVGPVPPRAIPNPRTGVLGPALASVPSATHLSGPPALHALQTPLPRPRPQVAVNQAPASNSTAPTANAPAVIISTPAAAPAAKPAAPAKPDLKLEPVAPLE